MPCLAHASSSIAPCFMPSRFSPMRQTFSWPHGRDMGRRQRSTGEDVVSWVRGRCSAPPPPCRAPEPPPLAAPRPGPAPSRLFPVRAAPALRDELRSRGGASFRTRRGGVYWCVGAAGRDRATQRLLWYQNGRVGRRGQRAGGRCPCGRRGARRPPGAAKAGPRRGAWRPSGGVRHDCGDTAAGGVASRVVESPPIPGAAVHTLRGCCARGCRSRPPLGAVPHRPPPPSCPCPCDRHGGGKRVTIPLDLRHGGGHAGPQRGRSPAWRRGRPPRPSACRRRCAGAHRRDLPPSLPTSGHCTAPQRGGRGRRGRVRGGNPRWRCAGQHRTLLPQAVRAVRRDAPLDNPGEWR